MKTWKEPQNDIVVQSTTQETGSGLLSSQFNVFKRAGFAILVWCDTQTQSRIAAGAENCGHWSTRRSTIGAFHIFTFEY